MTGVNSTCLTHVGPVQCWRSLQSVCSVVTYSLLINKIHEKPAKFQFNFSPFLSHMHPPFLSLTNLQISPSYLSFSLLGELVGGVNLGISEITRQKCQFTKFRPDSIQPSLEEGAGRSADRIHCFRQNTDLCHCVLLNGVHERVCYIICPTESTLRSNYKECLSIMFIMFCVHVQTKHIL